MQSLSEVSLSEFKQALTPSSILTMRIIHLGLGTGILMFALVILVIYSQTHPAEVNEDTLSTLNLLSMVHAVFVLMTWTAAKFLYDLQFSSANLQKALTRPFTDQNGKTREMTPAERCVSLIRTASILRLGILESGAFSGLAVSMLSVTSGIACVDSSYLFNMLSAGIALFYIAMTIPNAERIEMVFQHKIQGTH